MIQKGGVAGAVLNGANESAVEAFLDGQIPFGQIVPLVEEIVNRTAAGGEVTMTSLRAADAWARRQVAERIAPPRPQAGGTPAAAAPNE